MAKGRIIKPKLGKYVLISVRDELSALLHFCKHQWYVITAVVAAIVLVVSVYQPLPPAKVRIASGQVDSTLEAIAKKYQAAFAASGVSLELVTTRGALENLDALIEGKADIALSQGGAATKGAKGIVSLGSIGYQPLWFFHHGEPLREPDLFEKLRGQRISIGLEGSGTRVLADALLGILPTAVRSSLILVELAAGDSIDALERGAIDGMLLVAGIESGNVRRLLDMEGVRFYNFTTAEALTRRLPFMEVVKVPRGAIGLAPVTPPVDTFMAATTTTILARDTLHPAVQHLLLKAATEAHQNEPSFFDRQGGFPAFIDKETPRSHIAERYIKNGPLLLDRYLPHWLASFVSVSWFWIVALVAVAIPLAKIVPSYRKIMFEVVLSDLYGKLIALYRTAEQTRGTDEARLLQAKLSEVGDEIGMLWVPKGCTTNYGFLLQAHEIFSRNIVEILGVDGDGRPLADRHAARIPETS